MHKLIFDIETPLGVTVRCTRNYWNFIVQSKHPSLKNKLDKVIQALNFPYIIRQSSKSNDIYLFYTSKERYWTCAVIKVNKEYGFLVTAYQTDAIKEGKLIWKR